MGWNFWWGVAAFFLGGLATQLNGWLAYRRQRKDRADDAADALRQRREEFELQHLVVVNELLRTCVRHCMQTMILSWRNHGLPDDRVDEQMVEELREAESAYAAAVAELSSQIGFVFDDEVRRTVAEAAQHIALMNAHPTDAPDRSQVLLEVHASANGAYEVLTARVRNLYAGHAGA